jgi:cellulose synthase (UDP-forming)
MIVFFIPSILILSFCLLVIPKLSKKSNANRSFIVFLAAILVLRYLYWRVTETVLPVPCDGLPCLWIWFCFFLEIFIWMESGVFFLMLSKTSDHTAEADRYEKILRTAKPGDLPTVDVYIPTYNEDLDVLHRSIIGATRLDWPKEKLNVWVLDDGKRDWLKEFCISKSVGYIRRAKNEGAKAGNINYALERTNGDLVAIFDADFVVHKKFLYRTVGFFSDPKVAIVQTPQTFFNKDFVQTNLGLHTAIPDDQRMFFETIMPCRDAWNVAFFCGTSGILRRKTVLAQGKLPSQSITEDILLSMKLLRNGYITRYLSEKLSHGLAAESIEAYTIQRQRWCRGCIQTIFLEEGPLGKDIPFLRRLFFFPFYWILHAPIKLLILVIPLIFLFTGLSPMYLGNPLEVIQYQLPLLFYLYSIMFWFAPWQFIPLLTTAFENITAISLIRTIFNSLRDPFSVGFKVTPKGQRRHERFYHQKSLYVSWTLFILTLLGITINNFEPFRIVRVESFFPIAFAWCFVNLIMLGLMILMCFERPRHRREERFPVNQKIVIHYQKIPYPTTLVDLSLTGARIRVQDHAIFKTGHTINLKIPDIKNKILGKILSIQGNNLHIQFTEVDSIKDDLIEYLYTGRFDNAQHTNSFKVLLQKLFVRSFGKPIH